MTGGLQVQARQLLDALSTYEPRFDYQPFDWNSPQPADLYHFLGFPTYLASIAELVHAAGKPYVCTVLLGNRSDFSRRWRERIKRALNLSRYPDVLNHASEIIAIHGKAQRSLVSSYGVSEAKTRVVPHGVAEIFFQANPELWQKTRGTVPFLLCVGAIQARKNQLLLLEAANEARFGVVLIGPILPRQNEYAVRLDAALKINREFGGEWIRGLEHEDPLLASAYSACRGFVLLSEQETQPISALQAMAARKPVLLGDADYAREPPFDTMPRVPLSDRDAVAQALAAMWREGSATMLDKSFRWPVISRTLADLYEKILFL